MAEPVFRKSSYSANNGCVELAEGIVGVRDSKLGDDSPILRFTRAEVAAWLAGSEAGEFDDFG